MSHDHGQGDAGGCGCGGHQAPGPATRDWAGAPAGEVVCPCLGLTKQAVVAAIQGGAYTLPLVKVMTGAGRGRDCKSLHPLGRSCEDDLAELVRLFAQPPPGRPAAGGCGCGH